MSENMTRCLHCGKPMKLIAFACPHCGMPMSVDPNSVLSDEFLESIPLEDHLKTRPFSEILKEEVSLELPLQRNMLCPSDNTPLIAFYKKIRYRNLLWEWIFSHYFCPTCKTRYNETDTKPIESEEASI